MCLTKCPAAPCKKKIIHDASAYIRGLAHLRGRNAQWAEQAVLEGVSLTADEALEQQVIDLIATNIPNLLTQINSKTVSVQDIPYTFATEDTITLDTYYPSWQSKILAVISNPNVAYILMLIGVYGLFFRICQPRCCRSRGARWYLFNPCALRTSSTAH